MDSELVTSLPDKISEPVESPSVENTAHGLHIHLTQTGSYFERMNGYEHTEFGKGRLQWFEEQIDEVIEEEPGRSL